jgi:hypothetical protein
VLARADLRLVCLVRPRGAIDDTSRSVADEVALVTRRRLIAEYGDFRERSARRGSFEFADGSRVGDDCVGHGVSKEIQRAGRAINKRIPTRR